MSEYQRAYYQRNKEKIKARSLNRYYENREDCIARVSEYQRNNPEKHAVWCATYRKKNAEQYTRWNQKRRAIKAKAEQGYFPTLSELIDVFGEVCLFPDCDRTDLTIDHVVPLSLGGAHAFENVQILCRRHNSSKGNRSQVDYRVVA